MKKVLFITIILAKIFLSSFVLCNGEWHEKAVKEEELSKILSPQIPQQQVPLENKKITIPEKQNLITPQEELKITLRNTVIVISLLIVFYISSRIINKK